MSEFYLRSPFSICLHQPSSSSGLGLCSKCIAGKRSGLRLSQGALRMRARLILSCELQIFCLESEVVQSVQTTSDYFETDSELNVLDICYSTISKTDFSEE